MKQFLERFLSFATFIRFSNSLDSVPLIKVEEAVTLYTPLSKMNLLNLMRKPISSKTVIACNV